MKQALPAAARGKPLEIWFQDEARIGQKGTLTRIWARLGSRPPGPRDSRYEWAYIFAAVCPERATGAALVSPMQRQLTPPCNEHQVRLNQIRRRRNPPLCVPIICRNGDTRREPGISIEIRG